MSAVKSRIQNRISLARYTRNGIIEYRTRPLSSRHYYAVTGTQGSTRYLPPPFNHVPQPVLSKYIEQTQKILEGIDPDTLTNDTRHGCFVVRYSSARKSLGKIVRVRGEGPPNVQDEAVLKPASAAQLNPTEEDSSYDREAESVHAVEEQQNAAVRPDSESEDQDIVDDESESQTGPESARQEDPNSETLLRTYDKWFILIVSIDSINRVPNVWLRDHCQCSSCINQDTRQRQLNTFSHEVLNAEIDDIQGLNPKTPALEIKWSDGHCSTYNKKWITESFVNITSYVHPKGPFSAIKDKWSSNWQSGAKSNPKDSPLPQVWHNDFFSRDGAGMTRFLQNIKKFGFCLVPKFPHSPTATRKFLERIGPIRNTHYGSFYDFTADLSSKDTAYTSQALPPHTDTTYFSEPAGLQAFHLLSHTGTGGATQLVDGFRVADELRSEDRERFRTVQLHAHSSGNAGVSIVGDAFSVLEYEDDHLKRVRWNNDDRCRFRPDVLRSGAEVVEGWYEAARRWQELVSTPDPRWWLEVQLQPGTLLVLDNWRVLHGRTAFTGARRMCGGYIARDDFVSRWKNEVLGRDKVLARGIY